MIFLGYYIVFLVGVSGGVLVESEDIFFFKYIKDNVEVKERFECRMFYF